MINCPTCGHAVPDNQRFCGNCGNDISTVQPAAPAGVPIGGDQTAPYAYSQPTNYGYESQTAAEAPRPASRMIIMIAVLVLAACCAFACGILIGFELSPMLPGGGTPAPTPRVTPTPREGLLPIMYALGLA